MTDFEPTAVCPDCGRGSEALYKAEALAQRYREALEQIAERRSFDPARREFIGASPGIARDALTEETPADPNTRAWLGIEPQFIEEETP